MPRYLLVLSEHHDSRALVERALADAKADGASLAVVYVSTPVDEQTLTQKLTEQSFLSLEASLKAIEELKRTQLRQATDLLDELAREAGDKGVEMEADLVEGDFAEQALELARMRAADRLYLCRRRGRAIRRLIFGSELAELVEAAPCEVVVVEAE